jgi:RNA polymerase sigma factor (TIGR02999 family)
MSNVTELLLQIEAGNRTVVDELMPLLYSELRGLAQRQLRAERRNHTLSPTALVHEAYLKLVDQEKVQWQNRAHFLAIASQAMRRILINYANARRAQKRGGGQALVTFDEAAVISEAKPELLVELDDALKRLESLDERQAKIVEFSFFGGLTHREIATVLGVSVPTVRRDWRFAKAWLNRELSASGSKRT